MAWLWQPAVVLIGDSDTLEEESSFFCGLRRHVWKQPVAQRALHTAAIRRSLPDRNNWTRSLSEMHFATRSAPPPAFLYIVQRAFAGCTQLCKFHKTETRTTWRGPYAETNACDKCSQFDMPKWIHLLPPNTNSGSEVWADDFL